MTGTTITTIVDGDGEPWFVAREVCDTLSYSNPWKAVGDHCKHAKILKPHESLGLTSITRGITITTIVDEVGKPRFVGRLGCCNSWLQRYFIRDQEKL